MPPWVAGSSPAKAQERGCANPQGLVPSVHACAADRKAWMDGRNRSDHDDQANPTDPDSETIMSGYELIETGGKPVKAWVRGVPVEDSALTQIGNVARLPFIHGHVAVMPDVHWGMGATVGSVIPTRGAIIPAAVGVDIGCGMMAVETTLSAAQLPDSLSALRSDMERAVPVGGPGKRGSWVEQGRHGAPAPVERAWKSLQQDWERICARHPQVRKGHSWEQLGTLGTGNHFIELCLDEADRLWVMLHSGSRGLGNRLGMYFIGQAKEQVAKAGIGLADHDLAWLAEGTPAFDDYVQAVGFAQNFAAENRRQMMDRVLHVLHEKLPPFRLAAKAVNCHHNYVAQEAHFGADVWLTRKGAVRAGKGELGIIPGSMGARSYIVRGLGNPDSFETCSHGAGRAMSRTEAKRRFTLADHAAATAGVECRKDEGVIDETPAAYKDIDAVMAAQADLVEVVHTLRQVVCVKG
jgi:tRNA-splicing ligase RtcB (3'-phosphate/5'-hydroxy nucleic acid ligase)